MSDTEETWVVLYCSQDDSHVLVPDSKVIYDDSLVLGDDVRFEYPGFRKLLVGTIKGFSEDYESMEELQSALNRSTKPPREPSFHENIPRKAADKCRQGIKKLTSKMKGSHKSSRKPTSPSRRNASHEKALPLSTHRKACSAVMSTSTPKSKVSKTHSSGSPLSNESTGSEEKISASFSDDRADSSSSESSEDDMIHLKQLLSKMEKKKKKRFDLGLLKNLTSSLKLPATSGSTTNKANAPQQSDNQPNRVSDGHEPVSQSRPTQSISSSVKLPAASGSSTIKPAPQQSDSQTPICKLDEQDNVEPVNRPQPTHSISLNHDTGEVEVVVLKSGQDSAPTPPASLILNGTKYFQEKRKRKRREVTLIEFEGESLMYNSTDPGVVKIIDDYEVYASEREFKNAKTSCRTASHFARALTRAVFTKAAREVCSVMGKQSMVKGQELPEKRTQLNKDGVAAVVACVLTRSHKKRWEVPTPAAVKQYMGNLLCEERMEAKLRNLPF